MSAESKEILIAKFGTKCVVNGESIDQPRVNDHARRYAALMADYRLGIVSSGSRGRGVRRVRQIDPRLLSSLDERSLAGIGSAGAYQVWERAFERLSKLTLELKATHADMDRKKEGKSLVEVFLNCVDNGVIPVFNILDILDQEKTELGKIKEGKDNDFAAEHLARKVGANTLMLLTARVGGVLVDGEVQPTISIADMGELEAHFTETDEEGTGSMLGKVQAGAKALTEGIVERVFIGSSGADPVEILSGRSGTQVVQ